MRSSTPISLLLYGLLAACSSSVGVGLANAPVLGGATPDSRVHDAIANGRDACERSAFPPGEVLRGQMPPCAATEHLARIVAFPRAPSPPLSSRYSLGVCPGAAPALTRAELGLTAIPLYSSEGLVCRELW